MKPRTLTPFLCLTLGAAFVGCSVSTGDYNFVDGDGTAGAAGSTAGAAGTGGAAGNGGSGGASGAGQGGTGGTAGTAGTAGKGGAGTGGASGAGQGGTGGTAGTAGKGGAGAGGAGAGGAGAGGAGAGGAGAGGAGKGGAGGAGAGGAGAGGAGAGGAGAGGAGAGGGPACVEGTKTCVGKVRHDCQGGADVVLETCGASQVCTPAACVSPVQLTAGDNHACALMSDSSIYCWGNNDKGQVGAGLAGKVAAPSAVLDETGAPLKGAQDLAAGASHTCARVKTGAGVQVLCWGDDKQGQLGDGPIDNSRKTADTTLPALLMTSIPSGPKTAPILAAGGSSSCVVATNGTVYCWGAGDLGQLGVGGTPNVEASPKPVGSGLLASSVAVTATHGCAVSANVNTPAFCWGDNSSGNLGTGNTSQSNVPVKVMYSAANQSNSITTVAVGGGNVGTAANDYYGHSCALTDQSFLRCWGEGVFGGIGTGTPADAPYATFVNKSVNANRITGSHGHFCIWSDTATNFSCWGMNGAGELTTAAASSPTAPVVLNVPIAWAAAGSDLRAFQDPGTGDYYIEPRGFTCIVDRATPPAIRCTGDNTYGQLGSAAGPAVNAFQTVVLP